MVAVDIDVIDDEDVGENEGTPIKAARGDRRNWILKQRFDTLDEFLAGTPSNKFYKKGNKTSTLQRGQISNYSCKYQTTTELRGRIRILSMVLLTSSS